MKSLFSKNKFIRFFWPSRESYQQLLLAQWSTKFKEILSTDNYTPMIIDDENQYQLLLRQFPLKIEAIERVCFVDEMKISLNNYSLDAISSYSSIQ